MQRDALPVVHGQSPFTFETRSVASWGNALLGTEKTTTERKSGGFVQACTTTRFLGMSWQSCTPAHRSIVYAVVPVQDLRDWASLELSLTQMTSSWTGFAQEKDAQEAARQATAPSVIVKCMATSNQTANVHHEKAFDRFESFLNDGYDAVRFVPNRQIEATQAPSASWERLRCGNGMYPLEWRGLNSDTWQSMNTDPVRRDGKHAATPMGPQPNAPVTDRVNAPSDLGVGLE